MYVKYNDFKDHCGLLPDWYSEEIHDQINKYLPESKLQAVKYLKDTSKEFETETTHGLGLKECKDIVDSMATVLAKLESIREAYDHELSSFIEHSLIKNTNTALSLKEFKQKAKIILPNWYTESFHQKVVNLMVNEQKLNACKLICDTSSSYGTRHIYDLKWAKIEIVDVLNDMMSKINKDELSGKIISLIEDGAFRTSILKEVLEFVPKAEMLKIVEKYSP